MFFEFQYFRIVLNLLYVWSNKFTLGVQDRLVAASELIRMTSLHWLVQQENLSLPLTMNTYWIVDDD